MTRINVGIDPVELNNQMLIAEHREIKRIPNVIKNGRYSMANQPSKFTLGTGHVKFFYDKIGYLKRRYQKIYTECMRRGFKVTNFSESFEGVPVILMNDYIPTMQDRRLLVERINSKLEDDACHINLSNDSYSKF